MGGRVICLDLSMLRNISGQEIRGVLGMDFLQHHVVKLDFDRGKLSLLPTVPASERATSFSITFVKTRIPAVSMTFGDQIQERVILDTGTNGNGRLGTELFNQLLEQKALQVCKTSVHATVSGIQKRRTGRVDSVNLRSFQHKSLIWSESNLTMLGLGYLSRYVVTFDFPNRRMFIKQGTRFNHQERRDLSGLHLLRKNGKTLVHSVDSQSPADLAGVQKGDFVTRINTSDAVAIDLHEIRDLLSQEGRVQITVQRGWESLDFPLKLSDQDSKDFNARSR